MQKLKNEALGRLSVLEFKKIKKIPIYIILDNIRSLHNIGSVFRTSDAFIIQKIYLCGYTAQPPHKEIHKTALGATDTVDWEYREDALSLIEELKQKNIQICSIEQVENSIKLNDFQLNISKSYALIFGNEVAGVQQDLVNISDQVIEIPQYGTKHSLNIAVSAGIVLWELSKNYMNSYDDN